MKKFKKAILALGIILGIFVGVKNLFYNCIPIDSNIEINTAEEWNDISDENKKIIDEAIEFAKEKIGNVYVWGAKGEVITDDRLDELISYYGEQNYPLNRNKYIGAQAFDCSGLTYWVYKEATGVNIGYSTVQQREAMNNYRVTGILHPGDLIYVPGHVVMYIGGGRVIDSKSARAGVKEESVRIYRNGVPYRPVDYIASQK